MTPLTVIDPIQERRNRGFAFFHAQLQAEVKKKGGEQFVQEVGVATRHAMKSDELEAKHLYRLMETIVWGSFMLRQQGEFYHAFLCYDKLAQLMKKTGNAYGWRVAKKNAFNNLCWAAEKETDSMKAVQLVRLAYMYKESFDRPGETGEYAFAPFMAKLRSILERAAA